ncbi:MAG: group I intron-associated PD-(D/E)XK endonuclease [Promicromonosporaceae bacterium]|nr:group I intron-associated PD-(D/E)XK endonuclease [Promicromonosporaceae bacterium]
MARHHTKDKGDLGVAKPHADIVGQGFTVLFPATEHAPFDLVAYADGTFYRVQVKYRSALTGAAHGPFPVGVERPIRDAPQTDRQGGGGHPVHLLPGDRRVLLPPT